MNMVRKRRDYIIKLVCIIFIFMFTQINVAHSEDASDVKKLMKEIESLKERLKKDELAIQRTADVNAINNLVNKFFYKDEATMYDDLANYVAKKTPGVSIEIVGRGIFKGWAGAKRTMVDSEKYYLDLHAKGMRMTYPNIQFTSESDGWLALWHTSSPVLEVAGDGKTAKGVWSSLYMTTKTYDKVAVPETHWFWYKIAADFVKEDGEWKIWHYYRQPRFGIQTYTPTLAAGPGGAAGASASGPSAGASGPSTGASGPGAGAAGSVAQAPGAETAGAGAAGTRAVSGKEGGGNPGGMKNPNEGKLVDGHPMDSHGTWADETSSKAYRSGYSLTNAPHYWPEPPEPYQTFDENSAYVYPSLSGQQTSAPKQ
jgi:hypothetical protein